MHAVVRRYSGQGATELFDELERKKGDVEQLIRGINGFVDYSLIRTDKGGISVTVCQDKAGTDESARIAADWVMRNATMVIMPPEIAEGDTILQLS